MTIRICVYQFVYFIYVVIISKKQIDIYIKWAVNRYGML